MNKRKLISRFFFRNCAVSVYLPVEVVISRGLTPGENDVVIDRDFRLADDEEDLSIGDFARFIYHSSMNGVDRSFCLKRAAIGYLISQDRSYADYPKAFICFNAKPGLQHTGKTLFSKAIEQFTKMSRYDTRDFIYSYEFNCLWGVDPGTSVVHCVLPKRFKRPLVAFYDLVTGPVTLCRKCLPAVVIPNERAPRLLFETNLEKSALLRTASSKLRFVDLDFWWYQKPEESFLKVFGHYLFIDWDEEQWHLFDNYMISCLTEYLQWIEEGHDAIPFYQFSWRSL